MHTNRSTKLLASSVLAFVAAVSLPAATLPFLHPLFTDNMVLQRDQMDKVWGWTTPGASVTVVINSQTNSTMAGADGRWQVVVGPFPVGGPYTLTMTGPQSVTCTNVMMGDVFLCSGQSNMERQLGQRPGQPDILNYLAEAAAATNSNIRHFLVPQTTSPQVQQTISGGNWVICSPNTVTNFTAVGYETAKYLTSVTNVPIGLLHSSLGGTPIEPWLDPKTALQLADIAQTVFDLAGQTNPYTGAIPPTELYNAMVAPLTNYSVRAVLWYQGESNYDPSQYSEFLPAFMNGWRACFGRPNLPFIVCQLANYSTAQTQPVEAASYAELREAQLNSVRADANSRLVMLIDVGRTNSASTATVDLHQPNKEQVGQRCAWAALNLVYGQAIYPQGPFFSSATVQGTNILCTFTNIGAGLTAGWFAQLSPVVTTNGALTGFAIAGANKTFYSAGAVIVSNDTIAVSSPSVPGPLYVRYAWGNNPAANLYGRMTNAVGTVVDCLPASSFRNDPVYALSVNNGTGGNLNLSPGATASISASNAPAGESFGYWTGDTAQLSATNATSCTATMNKPYVAVLANYAIINAPASVQAVPGDGQVMLSWGALSGAHYNIRRATSVAGPFSVIYSNVNATNAVDLTATNGVTYYYQVAGTNLVGEGPFSAALAAAPNAGIPPPLISRYSFSEAGGTNAADSVGGFTGSLQGGAAFNGSGKVVLNGSSGTYVSLPPAQLSGLGAVTFEAWFTFSIVNNNVHLFSIDNGNGTGSGGSYLRYNLYDTGNGHGATNFFENVFSFAGNSLPGGMVLPPTVTNHVVLVYDPVKGVKAIYVNGVLKAGYMGSLTALSSIPQTIFALGRSPWAGAGDPYLNGSIDEFRVYGGAMNSNQVAIADVLGPNQLLATNAPPQPTGLVAAAGSGQVTLTWNATTNATGYKIKRSLTSGSGYVNIVTNVSLTFTNNGLTNGTLYYFIVSATNSFGEGANSTQVSARPTSSASVAMSTANAAGQLQISWPADHTGWQLQSQTNNLTSGLGTNWVNVTGSDQTNQMMMLLSATNGSVFFRLVRPY